MKLIFLFAIFILVSSMLYFTEACNGIRTAAPITSKQCPIETSAIINKIKTKIKTYYRTDLLCFEEMDFFLYVQNPINVIIEYDCILKSILTLSNMYIKEANPIVHAYSKGKINTLVLLDSFRKFIAFFPKSGQTDPTIQITFEKFQFDQDLVSNKVKTILIVYELKSITADKQSLTMQASVVTNKKRFG